MLFTGKGDNGTTKLFGCPARIGKDDVRVQALGNLDELNSWIGLTAAMAHDEIPELEQILRFFQEDLFVIQAMLAGADKALAKKRVLYLETVIARIESEIQPIRSFTIPGATKLSGFFDVARTIARRTERSVVALHRDAFAVNAVPYLNRLSSALFALARLSAYRSNVQERAPRY